MRFLSRPLATRFAGLTLHLWWRALLGRLRIHGLSRLLLVLRRWRVLARLLLALRVGVALLLSLLLLLVVRQRLAVGAFWRVSQGYVRRGWQWQCPTVELGVGRRLLTAPNRVSGDEGLGLSRDRREDTFLRKALAVGAAAVLRLIEAGATNLATRQ